MLNDFTSIFEITFGLNLAYAGSQIFRSTINNRILELSRIQKARMSAQIEELREAVRGDFAPFEERAEEIARKFDNRICLIDCRERFARIYFPKCLRSVFLMSFIISLGLLLVAGFESKYNIDIKISSTIMILNISAAFNVFIFLWSLIPCKINKGIKTAYTLIVGISLVFAALTFMLMCPYTLRLLWVYNLFGAKLDSESTVISIALFICFSPFILHFLRVRIHKIVYRRRYLIVIRQTRSEMNKIYSMVYALKTSVEKWDAQDVWYIRLRKFLEGLLMFRKR